MQNSMGLNNSNQLMNSNQNPYTNSNLDLNQASSAVNIVLNTLNEAKLPYTGFNITRSIKYDLVKWKEEHKNFNEYSCLTVKNKTDIDKIEQMIQEKEQIKEDFNSFLNQSNDDLIK